MTVVLRTWKRDYTRNVMPLDVAADNLRRNATLDSVRGKPTPIITKMLLKGNLLETPHAWFELRR